jgi:hypothetical protein
MQSLESTGRLRGMFVRNFGLPHKATEFIVNVMGNPKPSYSSSNVDSSLHARRNVAGSIHDKVIAFFQFT